MQPQKEAADSTAKHVVEEAGMPERQLSFLDARPYRPPAVPVRTSIAAAERIAEIAPTLRGKVYEFLKARGSQGEVVLLRMLNALQGARYIEITEERVQNEDFIYGWFLNRVVI
jgi:hypothetical protein